MRVIGCFVNLTKDELVCNRYFADLSAIKMLLSTILFPIFDMKVMTPSVINFAPKSNELWNSCNLSTC